MAKAFDLCLNGRLNARVAMAGVVDGNTRTQIDKTIAFDIPYFSIKRFVYVYRVQSALALSHGCGATVMQRFIGHECVLHSL